MPISPLFLEKYLINKCTPEQTRLFHELLINNSETITITRILFSLPVLPIPHFVLRIFNFPFRTSYFPFFISHFVFHTSYLN